MSKNKTRTKDKYRVVYNDTQRIELENEFRLNEYILIPRKQEIAHKLQLSERQIKIWFQNRRAKKRKQQKRKQPSVSSAVARVADGLEATTTTTATTTATVSVTAAAAATATTATAATAATATATTLANYGDYVHHQHPHQHQHHHHQHHQQPTHLNRQISSSQANFIQDNMTSASDATTTGNNSGRSSSSSSGNVHHNVHLISGIHQQQQQQQQLELTNGYGYSNRSLAQNWPQNVYAPAEQPQMISMPEDTHQMYSTNRLCVASDYANEHLSQNINFAQPPSYPSQVVDQTGPIYSPIGDSSLQQPAVAWPSAELSPMMTQAHGHHGKWTPQANGHHRHMDTMDHNGQLSVQDQQHYQMPVFMSESCLAAAVANRNQTMMTSQNDQQATRSHYATICSNINKQHLSMTPNDSTHGHRGSRTASVMY